MFTGIVEAIGTVSSVEPLDSTQPKASGVQLTISNAGAILSDAHLGDSISVNGTCLTVTEFSADTFKVGVAPETLRRTNLGLLENGAEVNLERAVSGDVRFGGHFVQGHVDTTAAIISKAPDGTALTVRFRPSDPQVMKYIVEKGYITLDGASLTVTRVDDAENWFEVMLVAYTQEKIIIPKKHLGESVNVEVDMAGKYIEKQVAAHLKEAAGQLIERLAKEAVERQLVAQRGL